MTDSPQDIYYKGTDTRQYLDYTWNHPRHIKRNIPYNLAWRIYTIVDDIETNNRRLKGLEHILSKGGYSKEIITIGINKARVLNQKELRTYILHIPFELVHLVGGRYETEVIMVFYIICLMSPPRMIAFSFFFTCTHSSILVVPLRYSKVLCNYSITSEHDNLSVHWPLNVGLISSY